jgi:hypothetical protein
VLGDAARRCTLLLRAAASDTLLLDGGSISIEGVQEWPGTFEQHEPFHCVGVAVGSLPAHVDCRDWPPQSSDEPVAAGIFDARQPLAPSSLMAAAELLPFVSAPSAAVEAAQPHASPPHSPLLSADLSILTSPASAPPSPVSIRQAFHPAVAVVSPREEIDVSALGQPVLLHFDEFDNVFVGDPGTEMSEAAELVPLQSLTTLHPLVSPGPIPCLPLCSPCGSGSSVAAAVQLLLNHIIDQIVSDAAPALHFEDAVSGISLLPGTTALDYLIPTTSSDPSLLLPLSSHSFPAAGEPPKQPVSRSLFKRHLKIKKERPHSAAAADAPHICADALTSSDATSTAEATGAANAYAAAVGATQAVSSATEIAVHDAAAITTIAARDQASALVDLHAKAVAVPSPAADSAGNGSAAVSPLASTQIVELDSAAGDKGSAVQAQRDEQIGHAPLAECAPASDCNAAAGDAPASVHEMSESEAAVLRIGESVRDVESRWRGAADGGFRDVENDLKALVLAEDQASVNRHFIFHAPYVCQIVDVVNPPPPP